jgi:hypothetical protein
MRPLAVAVFLFATSALASEEDFQRFLNAAVRLYESLEYERALEQVRNAKKQAVTPDQQASAALYEGIMLSDLNKPDEARAAFKEALLLKPDATIPIKVSPKVSKDFEDTRLAAQKELAPLLAKQAEEKRRREEEAKARAEAEAKAKAELERQKAELEQRAKDIARLEAERKKAEADAQAAKAKESLAEEQRRRQEADAMAKELERLKAERALLEAKVASQRDAPVVTTVTPDPTKVGDATQVTQPVVVGAKPTPVWPFVFLGAGAVAGGIGAYFGIMSQEGVTNARNEPFQMVANQHLRDAQNNATIANVLFGVAGAMGLGALISGIAWAVTPADAPPPPKVTEVSP